MDRIYREYVDNIADNITTACGRNAALASDREGLKPFIEPAIAALANELDSANGKVRAAVTNAGRLCSFLNTAIAQGHIDGASLGEARALLGELDNKAY